jgi:NAD(P)-dependent dehydrogenase (short-subunit alcohol dehydrogenase family)
MNTDHANSTVVITGANRGIGLALCKTYLGRGYKVIAVCRQSSDELQSLPLEIIDSVDVSSAEGIAHLKKLMADRQIDILVNNAGILRNQTFSNLNYQEITEQFMVNTLGPIRVVEALFASLTEGSKVALVTSRMGSLKDNTSGGSYGYRMSKCALNIAGKSMAIDFKPQGIAVALLHPGYVQTEMVNFGGEISAELSAGRLAERIDGLNLENSGTFWHSNGEVLPW